MTAQAQAEFHHVPRVHGPLDNLGELFHPHQVMLGSTQTVGLLGGEIAATPLTHVATTKKEMELSLLKMAEALAK